MELLNKDLVLREIPLFSGLSENEYQLIRDKSELVEYKKGEVIYEEGSLPSAFYYIIVGRVVICAKDQFGTDRILEYLHRGKYFGIISLLTGDNHSVTTKAINDCLLLVIKDQDFNLILKKVPQVSIDLSVTLSRRLKRKSLHQKTVFESTVISVFSISSRIGKSIYALNLALSLKKETEKSVIIVEICYQGNLFAMPQKLQINKDDYKIFDLSGEGAVTVSTKDYIVKDKFGIDLICLSLNPEDGSYLRKVVDILSLLINDYHYIVLDIASGMGKPVFSILNQSDLIHFLVSPRPLDLRRNRRLIKRLKKDFHFQGKKIEVIISDNIQKLFSPEDQLKLLDHEVFATLPKTEVIGSERLILDAPANEYSKVIRRIARREGDCQVGLVLGIGVAYGLCHVGVLKVIEEEKIPIDIIAGSSMGALMASLWAVGNSSEEILQITKEFREPKYIWELVDFTFPFMGFIKGNKLYSFLKRHFGNKTFYDLKIPLKIVASDVKRKEARVFDKGLLTDAIMASCAMPGVFNPFVLKEELLFDGGVITPLPTEPLFEMGIKKIIAVNVTPSREDIIRQYEKIKQSSDIAKNKKSKNPIFAIKQFFRDRFKTNILDIIFSSFEILQSEVAQKEAQLADVVLHPDTSGLHWMEFNKAEEFCRRGEEEAKKHIAKIWRLIHE